jgi:hypothetical protein
MLQIIPEHLAVIPSYLLRRVAARLAMVRPRGSSDHFHIFLRVYMQCVRADFSLLSQGVVAWTIVAADSR